MQQIHPSESIVVSAVADTARSRDVDLEGNSRRAPVYSLARHSSEAPPLPCSHAPLLSARLTIPQVRLELVWRPRLISRLDEAAAHQPLTLVCAPAGFGKTTLLAAWASRYPSHVCWLSLGSDDNDPARFLARLGTSLEAVCAGAGANAHFEFHASTPDQKALEGAIAVALNDLSTVPEPFVLVLDDYQAIVAQPVHDMVFFMVEHLPPQMHAIISTRADPPMPLSRLRARAQLAELRAADLRFTDGEIKEFFAHTMGLELSPHDLATLAERTEGWVVGLQMAGLSLQGRDPEDASEFVKRFSGSHHYVLDYLAEEVLSRQPAQVVDFLLRTSILERLTGPLCDAVTGQAGGQEMLESLERANLFVVPLDEERRWYRYHHLFSDLLRTRLGQFRTEPGIMQNLHLRAAEWYAQHDLAEEGIEHSLAAGNAGLAAGQGQGQRQGYELAARLIVQVSRQVLGRNQFALLLKWIQVLPEDVVRARPWVCLYYAWALIQAGNIEAAEQWLRHAEQAEQSEQGNGQSSSAEDAAGIEAAGGIHESETAPLSGYVALSRVKIAALHGDIESVQKLGQIARRNLPPEDLAAHCIVAYDMADACFVGGALAQAEAAWEDSVRLALACSNAPLATAALCRMGRLCTVQGRLHSALEHYERARDLMTRRDPLRSGPGAGPTSAMYDYAHRFPLMGALYMGLAELHWEWNDLEKAREEGLLGLDHVRRWGLPTALVVGHVIWARIARASGHMSEALEAIGEAEGYARNYHVSPEVRMVLNEFRVRVWLATGNKEAAARWAEGRPHPEFRGLALVEELESMALARVLIAQGKIAEANPLLSRLEEGARAGRRGCRLILILVLRVWALYSQGMLPQAAAVLVEALRLGRPEACVRMFVEEGEWMAELLGYVLQRKEMAGADLQEYARLLLSVYGPQGRVSSPSVRSCPLTEPLTTRELEVLGLMSQGKTNREIADMLVVAVGTVRAHTASIYQKLDVGNRTAAVARSRELSLV